MPPVNCKAQWLRPGWLVVILSVSSCTSLEGTEFERPDVPEKTAWTQDLGEEWLIEIDWWRRFGDPDLEKLVVTAVDGNASLRVLAARSGEARAFIGQAQAGLLPSITASASATNTIATEFPSANLTQFNMDVQMSWEIDVWGKTRKNIAGQEAAYQASLADWRAGHLALVSDVAIAYLQLRLLDERIVRQQQAINRGEEILDIYTDLHTQGLIAQTNVLRQDSELSAQQADLIDLRRSRDLTVNGLATLLGQPAGNLRMPNTAEFIAIEPVAVPAGLPSEILSRRPDIIAAEYRLLRACNLDAEARLAQLPSIGLTGAGGTAAFGLNTMFKTVTGSLSTFFRFPVFDPNVRARINVSDAQITTAEEEYRAIVIRTFEEVENALTNVSRRKEQIVPLESRLTTLHIAEQDVKSRLEIGQISYLEMLEGQRSLLDAEQQILIVRWQILMDTVSLFKAVGGGWPPEQVGI